jgi:hypothetical protein
VNKAIFIKKKRQKGTILGSLYHLHSPCHSVSRLAPPCNDCIRITSGDQRTAVRQG